MCQRIRVLSVSACPQKGSQAASVWAPNCRSFCCEMLEKTYKYSAQKEFQSLTNSKNSEPAKPLTSSRDGRGREAKTMFN